MDTAVKNGSRDSGPAGATPGARHARPAGGEATVVVIEEIFLEGDSMTMLRHEAGSAHARELLASADIPATEPAPPPRR